jgi:hypothetical protein
MDVTKLQKHPSEPNKYYLIYVSWFWFSIKCIQKPFPTLKWKTEMNEKEQVIAIVVIRIFWSLKKG